VARVHIAPAQPNRPPLTGFVLTETEHTLTCTRQSILFNPPVHTFLAIPVSALTL